MARQKSNARKPKNPDGIKIRLDEQKNKSKENELKNENNKRPNQSNNDDHNMIKKLKSIPNGDNKILETLNKNEEETLQIKHENQETDLKPELSKNKKKNQKKNKSHDETFVKVKIENEENMPKQQNGIEPDKDSQQSNQNQTKDKNQSKKLKIQSNTTNGNQKECDERTLFVKNLPEHFTEADLKKLSTDVIDARIRYAKANRGRKNEKLLSFGYLVFKSVKICQKNYKDLQNKKIGDKVIHVDYVGDKSKNESRMRKDKPEKDLKRIHISGFDKHTKDDAIKRHLSNFIEFKMPIDQQSNENKGFAIVQFRTEDDAKKALEYLKDREIDGKKLNVSQAYISKIKLKNSKK